MNRCWLLLLLGGLVFAQDEGAEVDEVAFLVAGIVRTEAGKRCVNARIHVWDALTGDRPLARGTTDDTGVFRIDVLQSAAARREHPFGPVRIVVEADGRARVSQQATVRSQLLRIVSPRPGKWSGTLRGESERPLPGAPISARQAGMRFETTTDENGRFVFGAMAPGEARITLRAAGHETRVVDAASGKALDVQLKPLPLAEGRLLDAESKRPIANARLVALGGESPIETTTDDDGRFRMEAGSGQRVAVYAAGYAITESTLTAGAERQVIALKPMEPVAGEVLDEKGEPVVFAAVRLDPGFGDPVPARTDAAGGFRFPYGASGFVHVTVRRRGYLMARAIFDGHVTAQRMRIVLQRGRDLQGRVGGLEGRNQGGIEIEFLRRVPPGIWKVCDRAYTGRKGTFRARAVPPDATHVRASTAHMRSAVVPIDEELVISVAEKQVLLGRVRDDEGNAMAGVVVTAGADLRNRATTDEHGWFKFGPLDLREYDIVAWNDTETRLVATLARPGETVDLVVERARGDRVLEVVCADRRAAFARVTLRAGKLERQRWLAPDATAVVFEGLATGIYAVVVDTPGYLPTNTEITLAEEPRTTANIALIRAGTLIIRATPGARLLVQTLEGEPGPIVSTKIETGEMEIAGFGPGRYRLFARAKGELIAISEVSVRAKDAPRVLNMYGGAQSKLTVTVTDFDGNPVQGAALDIYSSGGYRMRTGKRTDAKGQVTLPRLILGHVRVVATLGDASADKGIRVEPGQQLSMALELR